MIVAPSVLSLHYDKFNEEVKQLNENADWIHYDVMDGHFAPNLTFGPDILKAFRRNSELFLDVHLMVTDPEYFSEIFINAGADGIVFHYEVFNDIEKCEKLIDSIHSKYVKAGIAINPATDVKVLEPILHKLDIILIMSVVPGFGGQKFMDVSLDKIKYLADMKKENNHHYIIEVDGGINEETCHLTSKAGCEAFVAGSFVFKGDIKTNIETLRRCE